MTPIKFTVDARLLQELGERLVGKPHIALGELIKNSYDADATIVEITFDGDRIVIADNGHGMSEETFIRRWMRIGTGNKADQAGSPKYERPLTGSKGVGRLSAQLLAAELSLTSKAEAHPAIAAAVRWVDAQTVADLTEVAVDFDATAVESVHPLDAETGTTITLTGLSDQWGAEEFRDLAREIWALQPPGPPVQDRDAEEAVATTSIDEDADEDEDEAGTFQVVLKTPFVDVQKSFEFQMRALFEIANATITGRLLEVDEELPGEDVQRILLDLRVEEEDQDGLLDRHEPSLADDASDDEAGADAGDLDAPETPEGVTRHAELKVVLHGHPSERFLIEIPNCQLDTFDLDIKVFDLLYRQPLGITVGDARKYLQKFGGVHLYDNGFHLPYYGPDVDWLKLELDHARRISMSRLLPEAIQPPRAMQDLPSNKRVHGIVNISTSRERREALAGGRPKSSALSIQITRDRLVDNLAFRQLTRVTRMSIDLYAIARSRSRARRVLERPLPERFDFAPGINDAVDTIEALRGELPRDAYVTLRDTVTAVQVDHDRRTLESRAYASLLGSLATAGMTSLAYEHEIQARNGQIRQAAADLEHLATELDGEQAARMLGIVSSLRDSIERAERLRSLLRPLLNEEDREAIGTYRARSLTEDVVHSLRLLSRGTVVDASGVPSDLRLPAGTVTAWSSIVQNILVNAFRATLGQKPGRVAVDAGERHGRRFLRFQDNGTVGVDLTGAERLFLPFERRAENSDQVLALGLGGSGLGLTIVRMLTDEMRCKVAFERPDEDWSTAIAITWKDGQ